MSVQVLLIDDIRRLEYTTSFHDRVALIHTVFIFAYGHVIPCVNTITNMVNWGQHLWFQEELSKPVVINRITNFLRREKAQGRLECLKDQLLSVCWVMWSTLLDKPNYSRDLDRVGQRSGPLPFLGQIIFDVIRKMWQTHKYALIAKPPPLLKSFLARILYCIHVQKQTNNNNNIKTQGEYMCVSEV